MEITRITPTTTTPVTENQRNRRIGNAPEATPTDVEIVKERRRRPDRRQKQTAFNDPERRKRRDRRKPDILHAATGEPENLTERRGINIDASV